MTGDDYFQVGNRFLAYTNGNIVHITQGDIKDYDDLVGNTLDIHKDDLPALVALLSTIQMSFPASQNKEDQVVVTRRHKEP